MREQYSQLARLSVFLPNYKRTNTHRSVSGRTRSSNTSEVLRQGETQGSEACLREGAGSGHPDRGSAVTFGTPINLCYQSPRKGGEELVPSGFSFPFYRRVRSSGELRPLSLAGGPSAGSILLSSPKVEFILPGE